jgi:hypothetical protein
VSENERMTIPEDSGKIKKVFACTKNKSVAFMPAGL